MKGMERGTRGPHSGAEPRTSSAGRATSRACLAVLVAFAFAACMASQAAAVGLQTRPADPVVVAGSKVPTLLETVPHRIVAFRWTGSWHQEPVQVDQRAQIDLGTAYNQAPAGVTALSYTDPGTFVGQDPDPNLDGNDQVAMMARDSGAKATTSRDPAGTVAGSGVEVQVRDPLATGQVGYLYLFKSKGSLDPSAGRQYVHYSFRLASGAYKQTYDTASGPNPENTTLDTPYYDQHFSDRWIDDQLRVRAGNSTRVDILDRHKNLFAPGNCGRSEDTFSAAEGAFVVNHGGPVRAIRTYVGANSGPYTERQHVFYDRRENITTFLRVHPIPGVMDFFDYSPAASGMTYRNSFNPNGVTIDGVPDNPVAGASTWEQVTGPQGGLEIVHALAADTSLTVGSYYFDDSSPGGGSETQCTGDGTAYGSSGLRVTSAIPNTDPRLGAAAHVTDTRYLYFGPPSIGANAAATRANEIASPLRLRVVAR
jgi:hypothetical protein